MQSEIGSLEYNYIWWPISARWWAKTRHNDKCKINLSFFRVVALPENDGILGHQLLQPTF